MQLFLFIYLSKWGGAEENLQAVIKQKNKANVTACIRFYIISAKRIVTMETATSKMMHLAIMPCCELSAMMKDYIWGCKVNYEY